MLLKKMMMARLMLCGFPLPVTKDHRGWLLDPISLALRSAFPGGAWICASLHVGGIRPGGLRGNHRHHTCNETFLIWGAKTKFRYMPLENNTVDKGYTEVIVGADEVAVEVGQPKWNGACSDKFGYFTDDILLGVPGQYI